MMDLVPEYWPNPDGPPVAQQVRAFTWIGLPAGIVKSLVHPRRYGPHVAATGWLKVLSVHAVGAAAALVTLAIATVAFLDVTRDADFLAFEDTWGSQLYANSGGVTLIDTIRLPVVYLVNGLFVARLSGMPVWPVLLAVPVVHWVVWPSAMGLAPLFAAGERFRTLFARTLKLCCWSTAVWIPSAALLILGLWATSRTKGVAFVNADLVYALLATIVILIWWLCVVIRLGIDARPPLAKLRWEPREPLCEQCGYRLTGLPLTGRCPECARPVAESLPSHRLEPAWALARGCRARFIAYFRTHWTALRDPEFFRRLAVYRGRSAAIGFAAMTAGWAAVLAGLTAAILEVRDSSLTGPDPEGLAWRYSVVFGAGLIAGMASFGFVPLFTILVARFRRRDPRPVATVACYGMASILPAFLVVFLLVAMRAAAEWAGYDFRRWIGWGRLTVLSDDLFVLVTFLLPLGMLCLGLRRVFRAVKGVSIANG